MQLDDGHHSRKIRILHVAQAAGGVDRYLRMLLKYLDKDKFENILVCSQDFREADYHGLVTNYEQLNMQRAIGVSDIRLAFAVRMLIKKYQPDIVYAHSSKAGAIARMADIGINNICIYNPHGWAFNMRTSENKKILYRWIEKIASRFGEKIICISEAEKKSALNNHICKADKLQVIYNGIDIDAYEVAPHGLIKKSDLGIPEDAFIVGMVGRLSQQKAPDIFIRAAKEIKKDIPEVYFIMVGSGDMENEVVDYAKTNGLEHSLLITEWVENPQDYIELFDVALLLSRWEGFGLVLPEYMLAGKPIVATRADAIPEIVQDGKNGLLVDVDDVYAVHDAVKKLYANHHLRELLVINGKGTASKKFNVKRLAKEYENLFMEYYKF